MSPNSDKVHESTQRLFSTCPSSRTVESDIYLERVKDVACWSEEELEHTNIAFHQAVEWTPETFCPPS